ncbi:cell division protein ZipA [Vibrio sp. S17_S38]|uniref:cell division protein ZipA n=1 Tax=Vibrio sp. S17_S38 TaxID=2720229 RepID=UPI0016818EAF|nr:cell division protein ZipA [Vibrio sp. S17_S38]MBD1571884.1 cell division protein ZipA [Vibrio sp. S17_S38]
MQELRLVLIIVGGLAIAGLLVHGIWTNRKEGKAKFSDKPFKKLKGAKEPILDSEPVTKERKEPEFASSDPIEEADPLFGSSDVSFASSNKFSAKESDERLEDKDIPVIDTTSNHELKVDNVSFSLTEEQVKVSPTRSEPEPIVSKKEDSPLFESTATLSTESTPYEKPSYTAENEKTLETSRSVEQGHVDEQPQSDDLEVIVFHVHSAGTTEFVGTQLFASMVKNGLTYGPMDIFHRRIDTDEHSKVLFSVANMMNPGTLAHDDPADFKTKGLSFFMTLPGYGDADQTFKEMLRTAQQIADDLGANVLDDKRNLMTPDRLSAYRQQVRQFMARVSN